MIMYDILDAKAQSWPRTLDIIASSCGLVVLGPLILVLAFCIKASSPGPAFHRARRVGLGGSEFTLFKFRTMYRNAHLIGSGLTRAGDDRIFPFGRFLRKFKLDELPQFVNVLRGDMSLVGPRPEDPRYLKYYPEHLLGVLRYRPGITSAASLAFRNESALLVSNDHERDYVERILPEKLRIDIAYFSQARLRDHLLLILKTIVASLRP